MQILLTSNVDKIGRKGEIVTVAEGYGRNFLLKKRLGIIPTAQNISQYKSNQSNKQNIAQERLLDLQNLQTKLENYELTLQVKSNAEGHLFGAIKEIDILEPLNTQFGQLLDKSMIQITIPIKELGQYNINIQLNSTIKTKIILYVNSEK
ncbi:MAG: 50S ribosomal protein L9 [Candidatus Paceibacterota bacterium]